MNETEISPAFLDMLTRRHEMVQALVDDARTWKITR